MAVAGNPDRHHCRVCAQVQPGKRIPRRGKRHPAARAADRTDVRAPAVRGHSDANSAALMDFSISLRTTPMPLLMVRQHLVDPSSWVTRLKRPPNISPVRASTDRGSGR